MSPYTRCNHCVLDDLRKFAELTNQTLQLIPARHPVEHDAFVNDVFVDGHDVLIGGTFAAWLWKIPEQCVCGAVYPVVHILRSGFALCRFSIAVPRDWPLGHRWISEQEPELSTCPTCIMLAEKPAAPAFACPDCGASKFLEGPHGGLSINFCCASCGARFNDCVMFIERIPRDGDERSRFKDTNFHPRADALRNNDDE